MNFRNASMATLLAAALAVTVTGVASADPAQPAPKPAALRYNAKLEGKDVVVTLDNGSFALTKDVKIVKDRVPSSLDAHDIDADVEYTPVVAVKDVAGKVATKLPLVYKFNGVNYPISQAVSADRRTLTLTPVVNPGQIKVSDKPVPVAPGSKVVPLVPQAQPIASDAENQLALQSFTSQLGMGTTVGSLVGTAAGAALGLVAGLVVAGGVCLVPPYITCVLTALPVVATVATAGGIGGTVVAGGGALVTAGWDYVQTLMAPPFSTKYQVQLDQSNQHH
jgi:hypothetical protein